jgi:hypothetical protein
MGYPIDPIVFLVTAAAKGNIASLACIPELESEHNILLHVAHGGQTEVKLMKSAESRRLWKISNLIRQKYFCDPWVNKFCHCWVNRPAPSTSSRRKTIMNWLNNR